MTKGKHRKDEALEEDDDEDDDDDVEDRHNAKRFKMDNAEEENEASGKELSCHPPVESSTDVAESSLHVGMEVKDTSALVSEDQGKI